MTSMATPVSEDHQSDGLNSRHLPDPSAGSATRGLGTNLPRRAITDTGFELIPHAIKLFHGQSLLQDFWYSEQEL